MLIVDSDLVVVEQQLRQGRLACPSCSAVLAPWGHGRPREIRGDLGARLFLRPRRTRCSGCQITHVLLAEVVVPRRADAAEVIGAGLEIAALGMGHRTIAAHLGRAEGTVRGWLRRFRQRAEDVRRYFTVLLVTVADDPVVPEAAASVVADAVSAVAAAHRAAATKWPQMHTVSRWEFAGRVLGGRLLTSPSTTI
ncbi:DUF6431 domain-containing protein [Streptomyces violascens]|uniref:DUF6431 domain-containing protein n=1 Tax=Streptomyces violascens TaxID=67381 RepID=A0ABQ3QRL6_9ACTN|nr:DUF6431 domain-containing protein [Streptomyces violascens]GGU48342.1 hypothetical protein GCM10010289_81080 [Streptomyces violascens]GHI39916.1 hypothetical protein Sviol_43240 [Streptomyces violascens]